jgi:hypothetical protein
MVLDQYARLDAIDLAGDLPKPAFFSPRNEQTRRHVINRTMQSRSGRLYCNEEWDFDIPTLELYAAR